MAAPELDFASVQAEIQDRYQSGDYAAALDLAERNKTRFQDQAALFTYWQVCFNARLGMPDRSIGLLRDALRSGLWYAEVLLRKSPSLQPLQGMPEFEDLVLLNRQVQNKDETHRYPVLILRSEEQSSQGSPACPLLLGLHTNAGTVQSSLKFWRPAANAGWLVAAPQSRQAVWKDSYVWDDLEASREEILHHYHAVLNGYRIDPRRTVIAGHSMGSEVAIWLALSGSIPAAGFLAFDPGGPMMDNPDQWLPFIESAPGRPAPGRPAPGRPAAGRPASNQAGKIPAGSSDAPLRGYLVYGTEDHRIQQQNIHTLANALESAGMLCQVEAVPGAGHDFEPKFEAALLRGLAFISPKEKN
jgi:predicted esterase